MIKRAHTLTDTVAEVFKANPGVLFSMQWLAMVGGTGGWRTRVSQCRTQLGMTIENYQKTVRREDGTKVRQSFYRYVPKETATA